MTYLIIVPAYNAGATIADVLCRLSGRKDHLIVVDDGSTDATAAVARAFAGQLVRHDRNRGVGAAVKTGMRYAHAHGYDRLVTLDADGQHPPEQAEQFLQALCDHDLVVGSRFLNDLEEVHDAKVASNLLAALIVNDAFDVRLTDVACGYRAFRYADWMLQLESDGWGFLYEHLIRYIADGGQIASVPVPASYRASTLWATRALEIHGFLTAMVRYAPNAIVAAAVGRAQRAVVRREDFMYEIGGHVFHCFHIGVQDSYLVQTDTKAARTAFTDLKTSRSAGRETIPTENPSAPV
jgi:glycosyltransferase involved in cell wall biosynthesis